MFAAPQTIKEQTRKTPKKKKHTQEPANPEISLF
jgi:hypothetical protein